MKIEHKEVFLSWKLRLFLTFQTVYHQNDKNLEIFFAQLGASRIEKFHEELFIFQRYFRKYFLKLVIEFWE